MSDLLYTVFTDIEPEYEEEFNRWQEQEHCALLLTLPGYQSVTRYKCLDQAHRFVNFWHISGKQDFDNPERKVKAETPWGMRLSPYRHRRIDFYQQDGGAEQSPSPAELDERLTFLIVDRYTDAKDKKSNLTEQYRKAIQNIITYQGLIDAKIYHSFEQLGGAENYVFYYLSCSQMTLNNEFLPWLAEITPFAGASQVERKQYQCMSQWKPQ